MNTELEHRERAISVGSARLLVQKRILALQLELANLRMIDGRLREAYESEAAAADAARLVASVPGIGPKDAAQ